MTSPPLDSAHGRMTSSATCHHLLWKAHTVERRRAWHAIITFEQHKWSNDVGHDMPSCLWEAHTVERRRACHDITALGRHGRSNDIGRGMTSPPLDSIDNRQRRAWYDTTAIGQHTVRRRRAWHNITALGQHTWLDYVRRGMTSPPLYSTHGRTSSGVACHHRLWATHTIERRLAGHAIIAHGRQTRSNDVRRDMPSPPLDNTHGQTTSVVECHPAFGKHTR